MSYKNYSTNLEDLNVNTVVAGASGSSGASGATGSSGAKDKEINICKNIMKKELEDTKKNNETLYAYAIVSECNDLITHSENIDETFISIQEETSITKNILLKSSEYVFGFEMFPTKEQLDINAVNTIVSSNCVFHNTPELVNKNTIIGQQFLNTITSKVNLPINYPKLISDLWKTSYFSQNENSIKCLGRPNYTQFEYDWYEPINYELIRKRSVLLPIYQDGRYFMIGSGYTIKTYNPLKIKNSLYYISIIIFPILIFLIFFWVLYKNTTILGTILYFILSALLYFYFFKQKNDSGTYEKELMESQNQTSILIGITSTVIGLAIVSKDAQFNNKDNKNNFTKLLILSFLIFIYNILYPYFDKKGKTINTLIKIKYFISFSVLLLITAAVILYIAEK